MMEMRRVEKSTTGSPRRTGWGRKRRLGCCRGVATGMLAFGLACVSAWGAGEALAPAGWADCEVVSYEADGGGARGAGARTERWLVKERGGLERRFALKRTPIGTKDYSLCAYTPNRVLATLKAGESYADFAADLADQGMKVVSQLMTDGDGNGVYIVESEDTEKDVVETMTASIQSVGACSRVVPDYVYSACAVKPNDTNYRLQWALEKIGAPEAWETRTDASSVLVAVLDTGIDYNNFDLNLNTWVNEGELPGDNIDNDGNGIVDDYHGVSCLGGNMDGAMADKHGHGTHVAGIIGAVGNNARLVSGVAWQAQIMGLQFLTGETNSTARGSTVDAVRCLNYAEDHGVRIVNCSFMQDQWDHTLEDKMRVMSKAGTVFVCAAGNAEAGHSPWNVDFHDPKPVPVAFARREHYPDGIPTLVGVAATDENDNLANFSFYGEETVAIAAPGVDIFSTSLGQNGTAYARGTSQATPYVAGALALLMAEYPDETSEEIIERLYAAAEPVEGLQGKVRTGARLSMKGFFGIAAPTDVSATLGTIRDGVSVYWTAPKTATHFRVWRSGSEQGEKTMISDWQRGLTFLDTGTEPGVTNWYFVQAAQSADGEKASSFSAGVVGWRMAVDDTKVTVTFDAAGGQVERERKLYTIGEAYGEFPAVAWEGKAFLGWHTAAEGGSRVDEMSLADAETTVLHAHWIDGNVPRVERLFGRQRYPWNGLVDVTFELAGVPAGELASLTMEGRWTGAGAEEHEAVQVPVRTWAVGGVTGLQNGEHHAVWNAEADVGGGDCGDLALAATVAVDVPAAPASGTASNNPVASSIDLSWKAARGATSYAISRGTNSTRSAASALATVNARTYQDKAIVPGAEYHYWIQSVSSGGTSTKALHLSARRGAVPTELSIDGPDAIDAGEGATYTCVATLSDGSSQAVTPAWSIAAGSEFAEGIGTNGTLAASRTATAGTVTLSAVWGTNGVSASATKDVAVRTVSVRVSFDAHGGTADPATRTYTAYGPYGTLATAVRTGYTFADWYTAASGGTKVVADSIVLPSVTTLHAHWTTNTYTVRFNANATNAAGTMAVQTMTYGAAAALRTNAFVRPGYEFAGWAKNSSGSSVYADGAIVTNLSAVQGAVVNLYATWSPALKWTYSLSDGKATLTGVRDAQGNTSTITGMLRLPDSVDGYPVTGIASYAFRMLNVTSIVIPDSVTSIGQEAFASCSSLTDIVFPPGVTNLPYGVCDLCTSLAHVTLPSNLVSIGQRAFEWCRGIREISFPTTLRSIDTWAFDSAKFTRLDLPEGLTTLAERAFNRNSLLTDVVIPSSVTNLGAAFAQCPALTNVVVASGNKCYKAGTNCVVTADGTELVMVYGLPSGFDMPQGIKIIGPRAFYYQTKLTNLFCSPTLADIGQNAFYGCAALSSVTFSSTVTNIGNDAFWDCPVLSEVVFPVRDQDVYKGTDAFPTNRSVAVTVPSRPGYMFGGWKDVSGTSVADPFNQRGAMTVHAVWTSDASAFSAAADAPTLSFTTGGDANWLVVTNPVHTGSTALRSGSITNSQSTWLQTQVTGIGQLSFWFWTSCESTCDNLLVTIDGVQKGSLSGVASGWNKWGYDVTNSGTHTIRWTYKKDSSFFRGEDCCWVDGVEWTTAAKPDLSFWKGSTWASALFLSATNGATSGQTQFDAGTTIYAYCMFANSGAANVTSDYVIVHQVLDSSDRVVSSVPCDCSGDLFHLTPGSPLLWNGVTFAVPSTLPPGSYTYRCILDSGGTVDELDEGNNTAEWKFSVVSNGPALATAVDAPAALSFTTGGDAPWTVATDAAYTNGSSARSGSITNNQTSWMQTSVPGAGTISFRYRTSCGSGDKLQLYTDGKAGASFSDDVKNLTGGWNWTLDGASWLKLSYTFTNSGTHTVRWAFEKDSSGASGEDCCWVDAVDWEEGASVEDVASIDISGWSTVNAGGYADYAAVATLRDGTTTNVAATWKLTSDGTYGSISSSGRFTAAQTAVSGTETIQASFASDGRTLTACKTVTVNRVTVQVTFDGNGGTSTTKNYVLYGKYGNLPVPTRGGYDFAGWWTDATNGSRRVANDTVTATGTNLYAHWTLIDWTIDANGTLTGVSLNGATVANIPSNVRSIGSWVFNGGYNLTHVSIPSGVTNIGTYAFYYCNSLTNLVIPSGVVNIQDRAFISCSALAKISIPSSVTNIGESAFYGCSSLPSVSLPSGLTRLSDSMFSGCTNLSSMTLPSRLQSIGNYAFSNCKGLTELTIPGNVTSIGAYAFSGCAGLTSITVPAAVTRIGGGAFSSCPNLVAISVDSNNQNFTSSGGILYDKGRTALLGCPGTAVSVTIPTSVTQIGEGAFMGCTNLPTATIPSSVTNIGPSAFADCTGLVRITVPGSVKVLGNNAFNGCTNLASATISSGVTRIGSYAFKNCGLLRTITIPNTVTNLASYAFESCSGLTDAVLSAGMKSIPRNAFNWCTNLVSVTIPSGITTIDYSAFSSCYNLSKVTLPASIEAIGSGAFQSCSRLELTELPSALTSIGSWAFQNCTTLGNLTIPAATTRLDSGVFVGCTNMTSITVHSGNTNYASSGGMVYNKGKTTLVMCPAGKTSATVLASATNIAEYAFYGCTKLSSVSIPYGVVDVGYDAFYNCRSLASIEIPSTVTNIASYAFSGCTSLTNVTIKGALSNYSISGLYSSTPSTLTTYVTPNWTGPTDTWCGRPVVVQ